MEFLGQVAAAVCIAVALVVLLSLDGPASGALLAWALDAWDITPGLLSLPGPL